jgi:hypothetical protein
MALFKKLKGLFGKKDKKEEVVVVEEVKEEDFVEGIDSGTKCYGCQRSIFDTQKTKSLDGKRFHIMCYRSMIKSGKQAIKEDLGL